MDRKYLSELAARFSNESSTNYLSPVAKDADELNELASRFHENNFYKHNMPQGGDYDALNKDKTDEYIGMRFFEEPVMAIGRADDPGFSELKKPEAVGSHFMTPKEWMPEAKSVISLFLPFTQRVISSNTVDKIQPSWEWLFTRVDGQQHLLATGALIQKALMDEGFKAVVPQADERYVMKVSPRQEDIPIPPWSSNWSERHVGFVVGLGTFGRHTNFISEKGCCGRLISVITDWETEADKKQYSGLYDYCADCGKCYEACPANAFSGDGKNIKMCSEFLNKNCAQYAPRYGCGKCQSGLPCSTRRLNKA